MNDKTNVLVLGCGGNAGRNFVKCLRGSDGSDGGVRTDMRGACAPREGVIGDIIGTDYNRFYLEASGVDVKVLLPPVGPPQNAAPDEWHKVSLLRELCSRHEIGFIHAQPDPEVAFLARHQPEFAGLMVALDLGVLKLCADKAACQELWSKALNLKFWPCAFIEANRRKFEDLRGADGKVWVRCRNGAGSRGALPVTKFVEAEAWVDFWVNNRGMQPEDFVLAPYLPGPEFAVQTLWWHGELIHCQARERVIHFFATLSPSGQSSTPAVARTVARPEVVNRAKEAVKLVCESQARGDARPTTEAARGDARPTEAARGDARPTAPHGIFCVDLRCDQWGEIIPTEINYGRFFTTVDFFAELGVNSPEALVRLHRGEKVPPVTLSPLAAERYWVRGLDQTPVLL